ncbi:MAG: aminotransferase class IV, partial [Candidatus Competibacteraceae bacterium]|nr:aminotransferase class IV [Candidatus Competibacteraceae bacterium]
MIKPQIDWKNLGFSYFDTGAFVKAVWRNGTWSEPEVCSEPYLNIHIAATALNYGQACFEGLKAFSHKNGTVNAFRAPDHARRMQHTAKRLVMQAPSEELFLQAVALAVKQNREFVPPYGTGASLYIRPLLLGTGPCVGVRPSEEYTLLVYVVPIGPYYKNGFYPVNAYVQEAYDRAAPLGVGHIKAAGNYAAG